MSIVHVSQVFVIALTATIKRATFDFNFWSLERERERKRVSPTPRTRWDHSSSSIQFSVGVIDSNTQLVEVGPGAWTLAIYWVE